MSKKNIKFSVNQLIIDGGQFDASSFLDVKDEELETQAITQKKKTDEEVLTIKKIKKIIIEDGKRFVGIYFNSGDKFPYPKTVIDSTDPKFGEKNNPRPPEQIELDEQFFVLVDIEKQRIFLSNQKKKNSFNTWLSEKIGKEIVIKSIIKEEQFLEKIKSINKISFTVAPTLFNSSKEDILSNKLVQDIYGFDADRANIELYYNNSSITDKIIQKFNSLIGRKNEFENIVVIGRSDENFESVFNLREITTNLSIEIDVDNESKQLNYETVFSLLILKIKEYENH